MPLNATGSATATASGVWAEDSANYGPQFMLDGSADTRWACGPSGTTSASVEIDFGEVRNFNRILIDEYESSAGVGRITSFRLKAWINDSWSTIHTGSNCGRYSFINLPDQSTSKFRLMIDSATDAPSIWEIQFHQTSHAFISWRDLHFPAVSNSGPDYARTGDPDDDGRPNQMEFALNDDPTNPAPPSKVSIHPSSTAGLDGFVFTLPARNGAVFTGSTPPTAAADGIVYQIEGSHDLGSFNAPLQEVIPSDSSGLPPLDEGWSYHSFRHATPGLPSAFFRIKTSP